MTQLAERSLLTPEVRGSNPVIGKIYIAHFSLSTVLKDESKEKRGREWPIVFIKPTIYVTCKNNQRAVVQNRVLLYSKFLLMTPLLAFNSNNVFNFKLKLSVPEI